MIQFKNSMAMSVIAITCLTAHPARPDDLAPAQAPGRTITAIGRGTASAEVDAALLTVAVTAEGSFAQDAMDAGTAKVKRLVNALHEQNVADADISKTHATITARFVGSAPVMSSVASQPSGGAVLPGQTAAQPTRAAGPPKLNGYLASFTVTIKTRDLADLGILIDHIADNADNHVPTMLFIVADQKKFNDEARQKAFDEAERLARIDAERAHLKLGAVRAVRDEPLQTQLADLINRGVPVPGNLNGGPQSFSVAVQVEWNAEP